MAAHTEYDPQWTLLRARAQYFADNDFGEDGGYSAKWVKIYDLGPIPIGFPNSAGRVAAVRYHDLHHLATGYSTDLLGEAEIAAWELASGCTRYPAAWLLNSLALPGGVWRDRKRVERAFARGSRSRNLYAERFCDALLEEQLGELRERLGLADDEAQSLELSADEARRYRGVLATAILLRSCILVLPVVTIGLLLWSFLT